MDGVRQVIESGEKFQTSALEAMGKWEKIKAGSSFVFIMAVCGGRDNERSVSVVSPLRGLLALRGEN